MLVIPAVDIRDGKCVRLVQGRAEAETIYSNDPLAMARHWESEGADLLHVVDLDGAFSGIPRNKLLIQELLKAVKIPVQVGGGLRDESLIDEYLRSGAARVIVGTRAVEDPDWLKMLADKHPQQIVTSLDARGGHLAAKGWTTVSATTIGKFLFTITDFPLAALVYTDIGRDGMLMGPDVNGLRELIQFTDIPIIASGGVTSVADIRALTPLGLTGVIVGKALYTGTMTLPEAIQASQEKTAGA
ncbi:MAG: 1-(5-phosphoribosyl)-5-[(5-phosphoribosylamino)methylideneamino]imidazole-4-carboxamide isomerase [Planctomycetota bacterium]